MKVLVIYTLPPEHLDSGRSTNEFVLSDAAEQIRRVLPEAEVAGVRGHATEIHSLLIERSPEVVFNLCEAPLGRPDLEAHAAALFEWFGVRFTGSGSETLALCRRKDRTRAILAAAGVPVPPADGFPCIVKPADEDGSADIDADSICADAAERDKVRARIDGPVVVEKFLPGTEFVVSLWGRSGPDYESIGEVSFSNGLRLFTYAAKWIEDSPDYKNSLLHYNRDIDPLLKERLLGTSRAAWRAVGARGYLRLDVRLDAAGIPYVLDVNPNPEVSPDVGMYRAVEEAGWTWERFIQSQVDWAACR